MLTSVDALFYIFKITFQSSFEDYSDFVIYWTVTRFLSKISSNSLTKVTDQFNDTIH